MSVRLLLCLALPLLTPALVAHAKPNWKREFSSRFQSPNSWERAEAVGVVDVEDPSGVKLLLRLLAEERAGQIDWYVRGAVIEQLSQTSGKKAEKALLKGLSARQERVREGGILAWGMRARDFKRVLAALDDRSPRVVRAAVRALSYYPEEGQAFAAAIKAWEGAPTHSRLGVACHRVLRLLSPDSIDRGPAPGKWREYWSEVGEEDWPPNPTEEEPEKPTAEEEPMRTRVRGVELTYTERGEGTVPLLVIPNYATTPQLYRPWLRAIEDVYRVTYMELPKVTEFDKDQLKEYSPGVPYYPVELLVEAFDELRAEKGIERFALLAHGYNSLIAMRYLSRFPQRVSHMMLVGPISGGQAWGAIVNGLQRHGQGNEDPELVHMARNMLVYPDGARDYETKSDEEWEALRRKAASFFLHDQNDPALYSFLEPGIFERGFFDDRENESVTPDFELSRQEKVRVPILIQMGERSRWSLVRDGQKFTDHYPQAQVRTFSESAMCPFIEEAAAWSEDVHRFFKVATHR